MTPRPADLAAVVLGWATVLFVVAGAPTAIRLVALLLFLAVGAGWPLVRFAAPSDPLTHFVLSVATGLSLATVASLGMAMTHWWHPVVALCALAALTTAGAVLSHGRTIEGSAHP